ncbi:hypothetical protein FRX31_025732, partial [Thalictrum thalictroides]
MRTFYRCSKRTLGIQMITCLKVALVLRHLVYSDFGVFVRYPKKGINKLEIVLPFMP